jgi:thiol-disulfide isomerase/thioredoxin
MKPPSIRALSSLAILLVAAACGSSSAGSGVRAAPELVLTGLDGAHHRLTDYRGEVVLVNFWATWCVPCRAEMPDLEHEYRVHRNRGFVVLGVNWREGSTEAASLVRELGVSYPILLDSDGKAHDTYRVTAMPESFMVDRNGRIDLGRIGLLSRDQLDRQITDVLSRR